MLHYAGDIAIKNNLAALAKAVVLADLRCRYSVESGDDGEAKARVVPSVAFCWDGGMAPLAGARVEGIGDVRHFSPSDLAPP